eukprot:INCI4093.2.p1 GENE.INCI4093.2~~INCI4093.2.p1  ORF type:complete len:1389 (-),score=227.70 INCI4093.2:2501-6667(-)
MSRRHRAAGEGGSRGSHAQAVQAEGDSAGNTAANAATTTSTSPSSSSSSSSSSSASSASSSASLAKTRRRRRTATSKGSSERLQHRSTGMVVGDMLLLARGQRLRGASSSSSPASPSAFARDSGWTVIRSHNSNDNKNSSSRDGSRPRSKARNASSKPNNKKKMKKYHKEQQMSASNANSKTTAQGAGRGRGRKQRVVPRTAAGSKDPHLLYVRQQPLDAEQVRAAREAAEAKKDLWQRERQRPGKVASRRSKKKVQLEVAMVDQRPFMMSRGPGLPKQTHTVPDRVGSANVPKHTLLAPNVHKSSSREAHGWKQAASLDDDDSDHEEEKTDHLGATRVRAQQHDAETARTQPFASRHITSDTNSSAGWFGDSHHTHRSGSLTMPALDEKTMESVSRNGDDAFNSSGDEASAASRNGDKDMRTGSRRRSSGPNFSVDTTLLAHPNQRQSQQDSTVAKSTAATSFASLPHHRQRPQSAPAKSREKRSGHSASITFAFQSPRRPMVDTLRGSVVAAAAFQHGDKVVHDRYDSFGHRVARDTSKSRMRSRKHRKLEAAAVAARHAKEAEAEAVERERQAREKVAGIVYLTGFQSGLDVRGDSADALDVRCAVDKCLALPELQQCHTLVWGGAPYAPDSFTGVLIPALVQQREKQRLEFENAERESKKDSQEIATPRSREQTDVGSDEALTKELDARVGVSNSTQLNPFSRGSNSTVIADDLPERDVGSLPKKDSQLTPNHQDSSFDYDESFDEEDAGSPTSQEEQPIRYRNTPRSGIDCVPSADLSDEKRHGATSLPPTLSRPPPPSLQLVAYLRQPTGAVSVSAAVESASAEADASGVVGKRCTIIDPSKQLVSDRQRLAVCALGLDAANDGVQENMSVAKWARGVVIAEGAVSLPRDDATHAGTDSAGKPELFTCCAIRMEGLRQQLVIIRRAGVRVDGTGAAARRALVRAERAKAEALAASRGCLTRETFNESWAQSGLADQIEVRVVAIGEDDADAEGSTSPASMDRFLRQQIRGHHSRTSSRASVGSYSTAFGTEDDSRNETDYNSGNGAVTLLPESQALSETETRCIVMLGGEKRDREMLSCANAHCMLVVVEVARPHQQTLRDNGAFEASKSRATTKSKTRSKDSTHGNRVDQHLEKGCIPRPAYFDDMEDPVFRVWAHTLQPVVDNRESAQRIHSDPQSQYSRAEACSRSEDSVISQRSQASKRSQVKPHELARQTKKKGQGHRGKRTTGRKNGNTRTLPRFLRASASADPSSDLFAKAQALEQVRGSGTRWQEISRGYFESRMDELKRKAPPELALVSYSLKAGSGNAVADRAKRHRFQRLRHQANAATVIQKIVRRRHARREFLEVLRQRDWAQRLHASAARIQFVLRVPYRGNPCSRCLR